PPSASEIPMKARLAPNFSTKASRSSGETTITTCFTSLRSVNLSAECSHRAESVRRGLEKLSDDIDMVAIHAAARPCLATAWIDRVFEAGARTGAAILAIPVVGTLKRVNADNLITETVDRSGLWEAQTPQVFSRDLLVRAFAHAAAQGAQPTDEAQLVEAIGQRVTVVPGSPINMKITSREDLRLAEQAMKALPANRLDGPAHPFANDDMWR
ncbi:MAG: 2-C-methyl-D-erythritol 4-phosphate cytidylyltransferase, partial [Planctomycetia bacterium]